MKGQAILTGGFYNPEMARRMLKRDHPDFVSSDEDFDRASRYVRQEIEEQSKENPQKKRRRRKAKIIKSNS